MEGEEKGEGDQDEKEGEGFGVRWFGGPLGEEVEDDGVVETLQVGDGGKQWIGDGQRLPKGWDEGAEVWMGLGWEVGLDEDNGEGKDEEEEQKGELGSAVGMAIEEEADGGEVMENGDEDEGGEGILEDAETEEGGEENADQGGGVTMVEQMMGGEENESKSAHEF